MALRKSLWLKRVLKYVNAKLIRQLVLSKSTFDFLYSHMIQLFSARYKHYVGKVPLSSSSFGYEGHNLIHRLN